MVCSPTRAQGVPREAEEYYFNRLETQVLPNVRRLQDAFRAVGLEVIHTRIQSLTMDGRDRGPGHKRLGLHAAPGSKEAEFLEIVAPQGDEIVINKTASGVFTPPTWSTSCATWSITSCSWRVCTATSVSPPPSATPATSGST
jgi:nicotinamidase-related amidase